MPFAKSNTKMPEVPEMVVSKKLETTTLTRNSTPKDPRQTKRLKGQSLKSESICLIDFFADSHDRKPRAED
jgi:hypothetical protein